jgi:hypothetical protein
MLRSLVKNSVSSSSLSNAGSFKEYKNIKVNIKKGDLIDIYRCENNGIPYRHWVIFEKEDSSGNLWCFHVSGVEDEDNSVEEVVSNGKAQIKYEPLAIILRNNDSGEESRLRVNNQNSMAKKMLKTVEIERPKIEDVFSMLHTLNGAIVKYDIKKSNCEHYVTLWKYGIGWSSQVSAARDIINSTLELTTGLLNVIGYGLIKYQQQFLIGGVCILLSTVSSKATEVIKNIEITMNEALIIEYPKRADENKNIYFSVPFVLFILITIIIILIAKIISQNQHELRLYLEAQSLNVSCASKLPLLDNKL